MATSRRARANDAENAKDGTGLYERGAEILNGSPLGKYAEGVTAVIALFVIVAAVAMHAYEGFAHADFDTAFVDNVALIAAGVLFGSRALTNGAKEALKEPLGELTREVDAAHKRLDTIEAPPANDGKETP